MPTRTGEQSTLRMALNQAYHTPSVVHDPSKPMLEYKMIGRMISLLDWLENADWAQEDGQPTVPYRELPGQMRELGDQLLFLAYELIYNDRMENC